MAICGLVMFGVLHTGPGLSLELFQSTTGVQSTGFGTRGGLLRVELDRCFFSFLRMEPYVSLVVVTGCDW